MNIQAIRDRMIKDQTAIVTALEACDIEAMRAKLTDPADTMAAIHEVSKQIDYHHNLMEASGHMALALDALERAAK